MIEKFEPKEIFLTENAISKILSLREDESNKFEFLSDRLEIIEEDSAGAFIGRKLRQSLLQEQRRLAMKAKNASR
mgnify:CR=1 FL=1